MENWPFLNSECLYEIGDLVSFRLPINRMLSFIFLSFLFLETQINPDLHLFSYQCIIFNMSTVLLKTFLNLGLAIYFFESTILITRNVTRNINVKYEFIIKICHILLSKFINTYFIS